MSEEWNHVDLKLAEMRLNKVKKYIPKNAVLLDVGCGYHHKLLTSLKNRIKKGYGLDRAVSEEKRGNLNFFKIDLTKDRFPLKDGSVDVVTLLAVIEHFTASQLDHILRESVRVLKRGGLILLTSPTIYSKPILEFCCYTGLFKNKDSLEHKKYYSKKDLLKLMRKQGLKIIGYKLFEFGFNQYLVAKKVK